MMTWQDELLAMMADTSLTEEDVLTCLTRATHELGFRYFSFGHQQSLPISAPRLIWHNNYPKALEQQYLKAGSEYIQQDPVIDRARISQEAFIWNEAMYDHAPELRRDLLMHGVRYGWTKSVLDSGPEGLSVLALSRPDIPLLPDEVRAKAVDMETLLQLSHSLFSRLCRMKLASQIPSLTRREAEILRWTIDGKSAKDIADILSVSKNTVDFHIKNSIQKLNAPNKTAASIRAAMLGLLG